MEERKENRRVKVTKMLLKESFIKLLETKDIASITIKELCEDADINRSTFYAHYNDQYDLMGKIQNELIDHVEHYLAPYIHDETEEVSVEMVEGIFEYAMENARICRLLLSERGDLNFQKRVLNLVYGKYINELQQSLALNKEDAEYVYAYTITGCIGVIQKWLNDDMKKSPKFMAEIVINMTPGVPGE
ncbi:TetR-like C-terminal domain-containing protein [Isachenkonia alkalipeptolytica]|uniref:TetR/AcrR family transcriptional regulator n=1 Tax=Isachenkonia alkalipeptolytica TaxID=2565777 RepID=A0AA43XMT1_9CLOT|nr:TetR-like C-terminal domain-containing protein [Isachenkonia alkalipeptolytica]NBG88820.1 TetR/AcrR family transcriptional regulator [Isachenkonia alkalipeptolytica]